MMQDFPRALGNYLLKFLRPCIFFAFSIATSSFHLRRPVNFFFFYNSQGKNRRPHMEIPCRDMDRQKGWSGVIHWGQWGDPLLCVIVCARRAVGIHQCTTTLISKRLCVSFSFFFMSRPTIIKCVRTTTGGEGSTSACDLSTQVACRNHPGICIELERVQDGVADCPDASDEGESKI